MTSETDNTAPVTGAEESVTVTVALRKPTETDAALAAIGAFVPQPAEQLVPRDLAIWAIGQGLLILRDNGPLKTKFAYDYRTPLATIWAGEKKKNEAEEAEEARRREAVAAALAQARETLAALTMPDGWSGGVWDDYRTAGFCAYTDDASQWWHVRFEADVTPEAAQAALDQKAHERLVRMAAAEADRRKEEEEKERAQEEKKLWIATFGSDHLRAAVAAGYDAHRLYRTERTAHEFPTNRTIWDLDDDIEEVIADSPSQAALDLEAALGENPAIIEIAGIRIIDDPESDEERTRIAAVRVRTTFNRHALYLVP